MDCKGPLACEHQWFFFLYAKRKEEGLINNMNENIIKPRIYIYVLDWTGPDIREVAEELKANNFLDISSIYICADFHDIACTCLEDLKKAIETVIPLRDNNIIEIDLSKEVSLEGAENLKDFLQNHSGYMYFYNGKLMDIPGELRDRFAVLGWKRVNSEYFLKDPEIDK